MSKKIIYCLVNNLGGITTMLQNVIHYCGPANMLQEAIVLNVKENTSTPVTAEFYELITCKQLQFSNKENWYHVFKKLAKLAGSSPGVLIANDVYEMLMLSHYNIPKKVIQMIHDGYNVKLAVQFGDVADAFICHSHFFYEAMCQLFPSRRKDIFFLPYGVPIPVHKRTTAINDEPLKLFFLGRHVGEKGIFDLIEIENYLSKAGIPTNWLILGRGPETAALQEQWKGRHNVSFAVPDTNEEVLQQISKRDVFVFPTKFEGFPVALAEAMSVGCVPVASNLPGGLREVVKDQQNGFLCDYTSPHEFAKRIEWLHYNRIAMEQMSISAASLIATKYNVTVQSPKYLGLFETIANSEGDPKHHAIKRKIGSRLDQPWLPTFVTNVIRGNY